MCELKGMLDGSLVQITIKPKIHSGVYWRWAVNADDSNPEQCKDVNRYAGRYHKAGDSGRWYGAACPIGSWCEWREYNKLLRQSKPVRIACLKVVNASVVDLTDFETLNLFGIGWPDLRKRNDHSLTQELSRLIFSANEIDGLIAPSARLDAHSMIVVRRESFAGHMVNLNSPDPWVLEDPPSYLSHMTAKV